MSHSDPDRRAADAVVQHHRTLAATLTAHAGRLRDAADAAPAQMAGHRDALLEWLRTDLLPHAQAEEAVLYPAAAVAPGGGPLIDGMLAEHTAITDLVSELEAARSAVDAAAAARALTALFGVHLAKENDLVLPLLLDAGDTSVAELLEGMHDLIGGSEPAEGCGCGGCGCGGDRGDPTADAPTLTLDTRLDVRTLPHGERHARVLAALDELPTGGALVLVAPHAPRPLLGEIDTRYRGRIGVEWLQDGPDVWQIRLSREPATR